MRLGRIKKRARSAQVGHIPTDGFGIKQVTALIVAMALAVILLPVGARAASALINVVITDPGGTNKAKVDSSGHLQVAGKVAVDSSTPVLVTSADDPGREAFRFSDLDFGSEGFLASIGFTVPSGKRLVIQFVSMFAELPSGQQLTDASIQVTPGPFSYFLVPTFTGTSGLTDTFAVSQDLTVYANAGDFVSLSARRNLTADTFTLRGSASGYLINCNTAACN
jgi:hypothetical protein